ncbi:nitrate- and nitrite sensing domain-containing protein [Halomonas sp. M5N1S17]|uniref:methyl-accepting chemotaxis protein n=1 Tax=Halomonas alkalisoli TaxID=2907158 RepID=UPI001F42DE6A|nr:methyl-accepting chemotaxis protein [Halomonas alkalisoli]MCE9664038.1 nitrate- and nitrite sensing domain-containing protein [Halomonas alkalisoli]
MAYLLHRMPMGIKFLLSLLLPLLALAWFAGSGVLERQRLAANMADLEEMTHIAQRAGNLVHELQRERGMTAGFLSSNGNNFRDGLPDQRQATDARLETFQRYLNNVDLVALAPQLAARIDDTLSRLDATAALRQRIDGLDVATGEAIAHYTEINSALITMIGRMTLATDEGSVSSRLAAYYNLLQAKELAGIERAVLSGAFSADGMTQATYQQLLMRIGQETAYHEAFHTLATPPMRQRLQAVADSPEVSRVEPLRSAAISLGTEGGYGVDAQQWFDWQTDKIDLLKEVEDAVAQDVEFTAAALRREARQTLITYLVVAALTTGLSILFAFLVVQSLVRSLRSALDDIESRGGDLTRRLPVLGSDELSRLYKAFNHSSESTESLVSNIRRGALSVEIASGEIAQGNQDLAQRTEEQSASLVETASSMEQITATVRQTADNAHQARSMTDETAQQARSANNVALRASEAMQQIHAANQEVTTIVTAIDNIAFQTNLLALNASVEAARAGEHGRGFAVVAQEVRKLASRSAEEAEQIRRVIDTSVARINEGDGLVRTTVETLTHISQAVEKVAELVADMAAATGEQSAGIEQINQAISQLEDVTQQNAALVEQVAAASRSLDEQASDMAQLIGQFKVSDSRQPDGDSLPTSRAVQPEAAWCS